MTDDMQFVDKHGWPLWFVCEECGEGVKADEDGCCVTCGRDCRIEHPPKGYRLGWIAPAQSEPAGESDKAVSEGRSDTHRVEDATGDLVHQALPAGSPIPIVGVESLWRKYVMLAGLEGVRGGTEIPYQDIRDVGLLLNEIARLRTTAQSESPQDGGECGLCGRSGPEGYGIAFCLNCGRIPEHTARPQDTALREALEDDTYDGPWGELLGLSTSPGRGRWNKDRFEEWQGALRLAIKHCRKDLRTALEATGGTE